MQKIGRQYKATFHFLGKDLRWVLLGVTLAFVGIAVLADVYFSKNIEQMMKLIREFQESIADIAPEGHIEVLSLFGNNLRACLLAVGLGFIPFLFLPAYTTAVNAALIGAMAAMYRMAGMSVGKMYLFGILPHGIFELPAILLSMAMGIYLCYCLVRRICERRYHRGIVKQALKDILRTFVTLVVPLLVVAAIVESYVTPIVMEHFMM